jgi:hypothetical protein
MTQQLDELYARLDLVGTKLSHSGVKGMKWGVRRSDAQLAKANSSTSTKVRSAAAATGRGVKRGAQAIGKKVGPKPPLPESVDAIRAKETLTAIRAKGSLSAVSDADLNHLVNRINLEKRFSEVNPSGTAKGHKAVKSALAVGTTMNDAIKFLNSPAGRLISSSLGLSKTAGKHAKPFSTYVKMAGKKKK